MSPRLRFVPPPWARRAGIVSLVIALGCSTSTRREPSNPPPPQHQQGYPNQQQPYGNAPPGQGYPQQQAPQAQPYPQQGYPHTNPQPPSNQPPPGNQPAPYPNPPPAAQPAPAPAPTTTAPFPAQSDPINLVDLRFLRSRAQAILVDLVAALPSGPQQRVAGIPLVVDDEVGEVNAFAACSGGKSLMAISDGLLQIEAHLAQAAAHDEVFGTRKLDEYIAYLARNQQPKRPILGAPAGFYNPAQQNDPRKLTRQHQLLDEQVAFVLGHELAHHHLGHLPCTGSPGPLGSADVARVLSSAVPMFNQPNELAADVAGTNNVLTAGSRRTDYRWTERGGLITMQFFAGLGSLSAEDILFSFERTHPPPQVRTPVIQQTANTWRATGGQGFPIPGFGG